MPDIVAFHHESYTTEHKVIHTTFMPNHNEEHNTNGQSATIQYGVTAF